MAQCLALAVEMAMIERVSDERLADLLERYQDMNPEGLTYYALRELQALRLEQRANAAALHGWAGDLQAAERLQAEADALRARGATPLREAAMNIWHHGWNCCRKANDMGAIPMGLTEEREALLDAVCGRPGA
jgi:hypothetical protein